MADQVEDCYASGEDIYVRGPAIDSFLFFGFCSLLPWLVYHFYESFRRAIVTGVFYMIVFSRFLSIGAILPLEAFGAAPHVVRGLVPPRLDDLFLCSRCALS